MFLHRKAYLTMLMAIGFQGCLPAEEENCTDIANCTDTLSLSSSSTVPVDDILSSSSQTVTDGSVLLIQPGPDGMQDAQIYVGSIGNSRIQLNSGKSICVTASAYDASTVMRTLVQIPLPSTLSPENIQSAKLVLNVRQWTKKHTSTDVTIRAHKVLQSWKEGTGASTGCTITSTITNSASVDGVTGYERSYGFPWNQPGVGLDNVDAARLPATSLVLTSGKLGGVDFDITALAKEWAENPASNFGVVLVNSDEATATYPDQPIFISSNDPEASQYWPSLEIVLKNALPASSSSQATVETASSSSVATSSSSIAELTIQPGPENTMDAQIYIGSEDNSRIKINSGKSICMTSSAYDAYTIMRTLVQIPMPDTLDPEKIASAELVLNVRQWTPKHTSSDITIHAHKVLQSWSEGTGAATGCTVTSTVTNSAAVNGVTGYERSYGSLWNKIGLGLDDVDAVSSIAASALLKSGVLGSVSFDITALAKEWAQSPSSNFGVVLVNSVESYTTYPDQPIFITSDDAKLSSGWPMLKIVLKE